VSLDVSQPYGPSWPVIRVALPFLPTVLTEASSAIIIIIIIIIIMFLLLLLHLVHYKCDEIIDVIVVTTGCWNSVHLTRDKLGSQFPFRDYTNSVVN
jgi:hypothetical protein